MRWWTRLAAIGVLAFAVNIAGARVEDGNACVVSVEFRVGPGFGVNNSPASPISRIKEHDAVQDIVDDLSNCFGLRP